MKNGEKDLTIKNYEKSLRLNPENVNGVKFSQELKKNNLPQQRLFRIIASLDSQPTLRSGGRSG